jgi:hypothetical protein
MGNERRRCVYRIHFHLLDLLDARSRVALAALLSARSLVGCCTVHKIVDLLVWQTSCDCYRSDHAIPGLAFVSCSGASAVVELEVSNDAPHSLPAVAADAVTSSLSVVTRRASIFNPLFMSKRCLRSKLLTNSRVAFPMAPAMLLASTFIVRPSEPNVRSSYFNVTLYVFKMISLNGCDLRVGFVNSV